jgi:hypothetical protein
MSARNSLGTDVDFLMRKVFPGKRKVRDVGGQVFKNIEKERRT